MTMGRSKKSLLSHYRPWKCTLKGSKHKLRPRKSFSHTKELFTDLNQDMSLMQTKKNIPQHFLTSINYYIGQNGTKKKKKKKKRELSSSRNSAPENILQMKLSSHLWENNSGQTIPLRVLQ